MSILPFFSGLFDNDCREGLETDISHLKNYIHNKVPGDVHFKIPKHNPGPGINNNQCF